jgi:hypothetical protein
MSYPIEYASFLLRLWRQNPEQTEPTADWQGEVECIQSGQSQDFDSLDELLSFLRQQTGDPELLHRPKNETGAFQMS